MKFKKLTATNFWSYQKLEFEFDKQLCLINGINHDRGGSNGSGKSGLMMGLVAALFGQLPKDVKVDGMINDQTGKDCGLLLELEDGGNEYKILRTRKPNGLKFTINGKEFIESDNKKLQQTIEKTLGISYAVFTNSVYFPQNGSSFLNANDADKKQILTDILDLGVYDRALDIAKADYRAVEIEHAQKKHAIELMTQQIISTEHSITLNTDRRDRFQVEKAKAVTDYQAKLNAVDERIKSLSAHVESAMLQCQEAQAVYDEKLKITPSEQAKAAVALQKQAKPNAELLAELAAARARKVNPELEQVVSMKKTELVEKRQSVATLQASRREAEGNITRLKYAIQQAEKEAKKFEVAVDQCPTCYQKVDREHLNKLKQECLQVAVGLTGELGLAEQVLANEPLPEILNQILYDLQNDVYEAEKVVTEEAQQIQSAVREVEKKVEAATRQIQSEVYEAEKKLMEETAIIQKTVNEAEKKLNKAKADYQLKKQESNAEMRSRSDAEQALKTKQAEENTYETLLQESLIRLSELKTAYTVNDGAVKHHEATMEALTMLKEAFGNKGIKAYIFDNVVAELNTRANMYMRELYDDDVRVEFVTETENAKGEAKQVFGTKIFVNQEEKVLGRFSGGEERGIILAVNLALSDIISTRAKKSFNVLFCDEVLDGIDNEGKAKAMQLLRRIAEMKDGVFVIDHATEFQSLFDNVVTVEKRGGMSSIT